MERRGAGAGRRVDLRPGVMGRALLVSGRILVRGIAGPAEEVRGHENGDHHHQGRQDDFNMHFCSHPGVNGRLSREAGHGMPSLESVFLEAHPGVPIPTLAGIRAIFADLHLPGEFTTRPGLVPPSCRIQPEDPAAGRALAAPFQAPQVLLCRTAHGGNTGLSLAIRSILLISSR